MIDTAIDGIALAGDAITIGALLLGQLQVAFGSEIVGDIVGAVGVVKGAYDLYENHDASGLLSGEFFRAASKTAWRVEGEFPVIGTIGDGINLYRDLNPKITIQWKIP